MELERRSLGSLCLAVFCRLCSPCGGVWVSHFLNSWPSLVSVLQHACLWMPILYTIVSLNNVALGSPQVIENHYECETFFKTHGWLTEAVPHEWTLVPNDHTLASMLQLILRSLFGESSWFGRPGDCGLFQGQTLHWPWFTLWWSGDFIGASAIVWLSLWVPDRKLGRANSDVYWELCYPRYTGRH